jgi:DNA adenine methylase
MKTLKTPIKYWGGKQQLADKIIASIPKHTCYTEAFFGGGAVFFKKPPSKVEVINDINDNMVNFYKTIKRDFEGLSQEVDTTLYSEWQFNEARDLWKEGGSSSEIMRAWAVFVLSHQSFSGNLGSSWAFSDQSNQAKRFDKTKQMFDERYVKRLENVQIFCRDALNVIQNTDHPDTFHFVDPPYFNSDLGHYDGYTEADFIELLELLSSLEGKFLLTSYPSDILEKYAKNNEWNTINNDMHLSASTTKGAMKTEVFTLNYTPSIMPNLLFD